MNRLEFTKYIEGLNDFDLYLLAKNLNVSSLMGSDIFEWKFELLQTESGRRHKDIYNSAIDDASIIYASRDSAKSETCVKDILRPSLMSMTSFRKYLGGVDVVKADADGWNSSDMLHEILSEENDKYLLCKVSGDSMIDEGIFDDDVLMVDKDEQSIDGKIIVAYLNDILFVKRYQIINGQKYLISGNEKYKPYPIDNESNFKLLGVVKLVIKSVS